MQNEPFEKMTEAYKSSYATMQEFGEINNKLMKEITELQMSLATYSIGSGVGLTKTLTATTNYQDLISAEAEYADECGSKMLEFSRKTVGLLTETRDEIVNLFENAVESATVETKSAPKHNRKKAA